MITRERLMHSDYGKGLLALYDRLVSYKVKDWGNDDSNDKDNNRPGDREEVPIVEAANVITSLHRPDPFDLLNETDDPRHALVLDIDHPSWLMPSTTPGHYHLYVDVPGGIPSTEYYLLLTALANARVIEAGYAGASAARGFTSVRLPWVAKEKGPKQHD